MLHDTNAQNIGNHPKIVTPRPLPQDRNRTIDVCDTQADDCALSPNERSFTSFRMTPLQWAAITIVVRNARQGAAVFNRRLK
jgi:hypothetical protein